MSDEDASKGPDKGNKIPAVPDPGSGIPALETLKLELEIWKKTIDVQQHFNDLQMRIRNFAITLLVAFYGFAAVALNEWPSFAGIPLAAWLLWVGGLGWLCFYGMDVFWYHRFLKGSVIHAKRIEDRLGTGLQSIGLSTAIGDASSWKIGRWEFRSTMRSHIFYVTIALLTLSLGAVVWLAGPHNSRSCVSIVAPKGAPTPIHTGGQIINGGGRD